MIFRSLCVFFFLSLFILQPCLAAVADSQKQLEEITARIAEAEKNLQSNRKSELKVSRELAVLEKTLQRIESRIKVLAAEQKQLRSQIGQQQQLIQENRKQTRQLTAQLKKRLIALYKEGEAGSLKVLFSADTPTEMVQQYHYLTKVLEHDKALLAEYRVVFNVQKGQLDQLNALELEKERLIKDEKKQRNLAAEGRKLNSWLLAQAKNEKGKLQQELEQLKENASRLRGLITNLKKEPIKHSTATADHFAVGRGKLRWPLEGAVIISFGTKKDKKLGTLYESNGIEIAARPGTAIKAVAAGKVVFADYFKGYGNLYILSHPGGYHTLYAQTDRMQKRVGDDVAAGTVLGYSGLAGRESIYFEIRSQGSPVDPLSWLIRR